MKKISSLLFYGFLIISFFSSSLSATHYFELEEQDLIPYVPFNKYKEMIKSGQQNILLDLNPDINEIERAQVRDNIERLAIEGEPLSIKYLWKRREHPDSPEIEIEKKAALVRDFLANDLELLALGEIGILISDYSSQAPTFLPTLNTLIETAPDVASLTPKLKLARSLGYAVSDEDPAQKHISLIKAWNLLKEFENSPEAKTETAQNKKYTQRAYGHLFDNALKSNFTNSFDLYITSLLEADRDDNPSKQGLPLFYRVLRGTPHLLAIKMKYDIDFIVNF